MENEGNEGYIGAECMTYFCILSNLGASFGPPLNCCLNLEGTSGPFPIFPFVSACTALVVYHPQWLNMRRQLPLVMVLSVRTLPGKEWATDTLIAHVSDACVMFGTPEGSTFWVFQLFGKEHVTMLCKVAVLEGDEGTVYGSPFDHQRTRPQMRIRLANTGVMASGGVLAMLIRQLRLISFYE